MGINRWVREPGSGGNYVLTERTYRALLIGNSEFPADNGLKSLYGPKNDVAAMREALTHPDWGLHNPDCVEELTDGSKASIERKLELFFSEATSTDQLFLYFSSHGLNDLYERLFLACHDTESKLTRSTTVAMSFINDLAEATQAAATVVVLDCCNSGILKGKEPAWAAGGRGRWSIASSRRDQGSLDASSEGATSPFTKLVAEALVAHSEIDVNGDGFVTVTDIVSYVGPRLEAETGQNITHRFDGSGELPVALASGYPIEFQPDDRSYVVKHGHQIPVVDVPSQTLDRDETLGPLTELKNNEIQVEPLSWQLPEGEFRRKVLAALHGKQTIPLKLTLQRAPRDAQRLLENDAGWEGLGPLLDRVASMTSTFLLLEEEDWFNRAVASLSRMYELGFNAEGFSRNNSPALGGIPSPEYWYGLYERIAACGAFAVRQEAWSAVRKLIMQRPAGYDFRHYNNWIRHAITEAARANLFRREVDGQFVEGSALEDVRSLVTEEAGLRPDIEASDQEALLNSLCQFDALACIAALAATDVEEMDSFHGGGNYYPNFAKFRSYRSEPAFRLLIANSEARQEIAPVENSLLARIYQEVGRTAENQARMLSGWHGFESIEVRDFLEANGARW